MSANLSDNQLTVTIFDDGPVEIHGPVTLLDETGRAIATVGVGETAYLCRCGGSNDKPFCDGTHAKIGFKSREGDETAHKEPEPEAGG